MTDDAYELSLVPPARRMLAEGPPRGLPLAVTAAVVEFLTGALLDNPRKIGNPLARELSEHLSARRGAYRVVYRIDDDARVVHVVRIDHRADVYHARRPTAARTWSIVTAVHASSCSGHGQDMARHRASGSTRR